MQELLILAVNQNLTVEVAHDAQTKLLLKQEEKHNYVGRIITINLICSNAKIIF